MRTLKNEDFQYAHSVACTKCKAGHQSAQLQHPKPKKLTGIAVGSLEGALWRGGNVVGQIGWAGTKGRALGGTVDHPVDTRDLEGVLRDCGQCWMAVYVHVS